MNSIPTIPDRFHEQFDKMWHSACLVCDHVQSFKPDLVLALMHSGWGPVFAAKVLWEQTQTIPFPPVARSNLGREKMDVFDSLFNNMTASWFVGEFTTDLDKGKLLSWIATRTDWHMQLRKQIEEVLLPGTEPKRILVVDDTVHEGSTCILTLGILNWVYPAALVRFLDSQSWYRSNYREFLVEAVCSMEELFPGGVFPDEETREQVAWVAIGSEDVSRDSLDWRPITVESPAVQALTAYRPAEDWIHFSQTIYTLIAQSIRERAPTYKRKRALTRDTANHLTRASLIYRDIWLNGSITRRQIEQKYGMTRREVEKLLDRWIEWDDLMVDGRGRGARYIIPPLISQYVNKLADYPKEPKNLYWLLPDRLMFGGRPYFLEDQVSDNARKHLLYLFQSGINCWLDVQILREGNAPKDNRLFRVEAEAAGHTAVTHVIALMIEYVDGQNYIRRRRGRPNRKDIRLILDMIDQLLAEGYTLLVSADSSDLRGILAGCYLARHGQAGRAAIAGLKACRAGSVWGWRREPPSSRAQRYVRNWPEGF